MWEKIRSMGVLRNLLHLLAAAYVVVLPFSEPKRVLEGWDLVFGGIIPATAPLVVIIILFDVMMCQVMKSDATDERRAQLGFISRVHLVFAGLVLGLWLYSFKSVLLL